jgi:hypothetical protein
VFTDAPASDSDRLNEAIALISRQGVTVSFALVSSFRKRSLTNSRGQRSVDETKYRARRQSGDDVYDQVAKFSGGQILNIHTNDISDLASLISFSARQSRSTIFRRSGNLYGTVTYTFPVDISTTEVIISINGPSITVSINTPEG